MSKKCICGKQIKDGYDLCYICAQRKAAEEGRMCACGKFKKPEFDVCYNCSQLKRTATAKKG